MGHEIEGLHGVLGLLKKGLHPAAAEFVETKSHLKFDAEGKVPVYKALAFKQLRQDERPTEITNAKQHHRECFLSALC